ncbi:hypothetical protein [Seonamhaeicola aphaedonensis]|uniref:Uncharacterized protein n=1 Tax=Seonamhaeicola aphaedonensis TaxID=1461338 RepID=A0A3D9HHR7_9FLAO|nr:hypothetical protein [Seonamhaeicola aphaedonensis]RED49013.1 hypothetical protein DFQ02_103345 [Seonamhaeicola aphaedonensis]
MKLLIQIFLAFLFVTVFTDNIIAQNDIVLKIDGTEMIGKVIAIGETSINFIYKDETIEYKVPKIKIAKITFSSGRVEFYNESSSLADHHNKVAILPFAFLKNKDNGSSAMSKKIQQETYSIFNTHKGVLNFQDPMTTNRLLGKAGIGAEDEENYSMGELCDILGVEFVVQGLVSLEETSVSSYSASNTNIQKNDKKPAKTFVGKLFDNSGTNISTSRSSTSIKNYRTTITMNVYNDKGENIFSKDHESFWQSDDAYKITLKFLAKRTPLYTK